LGAGCGVRDRGVDFPCAAEIVPQVPARPGSAQVQLNCPVKLSGPLALTCGLLLWVVELCIIIHLTKASLVCMLGLRKDFGIRRWAWVRSLRDSLSVRRKLENRTGERLTGNALMAPLARMYLKQNGL